MLWLTCMARTATPAKARPTPPSEAPSATEPAAGWPRPIIASAIAAASATFATVTTTSAAAVDA